MTEIIKGIGGAFGQGFGIAIGEVLVIIVVAFLMMFLASAVLGILFLFLSIKFYKSGKKKAFLLTAIVTVISLSTFSSFLLSSLIADNLNLIVILFPIFLIFGISVVIKKYKKIK